MLFLKFARRDSLAGRQKPSRVDDGYAGRPKTLGEPCGADQRIVGTLEGAHAGVSIQGGVGKPFSLRKSGLNNFD